MLIRPIDALLPRLGRHFGGKATGLAALVRAGFPVPAAYALSREAADEVFARVLPVGLRIEDLAPTTPGLEERLARARELVLHASLPAALERELSRTFASLRSAAVESVAVRSSCTIEDHAVASAAGLFATTLNVRDEAALFDAVRRSWASLFSSTALGYAHALGHDEAFGMGVVIQALVPAEAAGVCFTANPLTGDADELVVHACFGLGVPVTDGRCTPDTFRIDKLSGFVRDRVIAEKRTRLVAEPHGGLREALVPDHLTHVQSLDEHVLAQLTVLGRRIEEQFGEPRDVEFAVAGDTVYVLQSRPVSLLGADSARTRSKRKRTLDDDPATLVWSNRNVGEALPGVATPLTWSVLSGFSELGFREVFAALGCKMPKGAQLLGSFRGRIYLNLTELSRVAAQVPGLKPSHVFPLGGSTTELERVEAQRAASSARGQLLRLPAIAARFASTHLRFEQRVLRFESGFEAERERIERLDLRILPGAALDETLSDVEKLLSETGALLLHAYGGLLAALLPLRGALDVLAGRHAPTLLQSLLSAIEGVESAAPGIAILSAAVTLGSDDVARDALLHGHVTSPADLPKGRGRDEVESLLVRYGHRAVREVELAAPRWRENPGLVFDALRAQLRHAGEGDPKAALERRVEALRAGADRALGELPAPARPALRALLTVVRRYVRRREQLRSHAMHVLGMYRRIALDASRRMLVREPNAGPNAAFMLTREELHAFLRGELRSVVALVALRARQYERDTKLPDPPDTFVGYPPPLPPAVSSQAPSVDRISQLHGLAASAGEVEGRVRVLRDPDASLEPGEILVVSSADVGWTPLFVLAGGLVSELGGPLSHACVVAREYGLPAVVSVRSATRALKTGDRVRLDGSAGTVELLGHG